jgi:DNA-binding transcriptional regulator YiaG
MSLELVIGGTSIKIDGQSRVEVGQDISVAELQAEIVRLKKRIWELESAAAAATTTAPDMAVTAAPTPVPRMERTSSYAKKKIGGKIRARREYLGLSQGEVRRRAGLPESMMSLYETGRRYPTPDRITALEVALELPAGSLG